MAKFDVQDMRPGPNHGRLGVTIARGFPNVRDILWGGWQLETRVASKLIRELSAMTYRVTSSPFDEPTPLPWDYDEDAFVSWVNEVFLEGYKQEEGAPFPTVQECLDILEGAGYGVEKIEEED